ncbi:hypothetical protein FRC17_008958 [Serendipita sp. 399]|nr:hypothetical protein FRC17_008958 [Serendipita sp. 399]
MSIRSAVHGGDINGGYRIFTQSHRQAVIDQPPDKAVKQELKIRYLAHILVHTLHKTSQPQAAITFAELCLNRGIRIHTKTFESVINRSITHTGAIQASPAASPSLAATISLLAAARRSGHRHHSWMYDRIIHALLLQGEVLTAALLFCTLVKEWNRMRSQQTGTQEADPNPSTTKAPVEQSRRNQSLIPLPRRSNMIGILEAIKKLREEGHQSTKGADALSALIPLLDRDCRVVPARWQLLRALYRLPHEKWPDLATYECYNSAISALCTDIDDRCLDLASYHILLQYSLRERQSVDLCANVLRALCLAHTPTLVTYNILLRETARSGMHEVFNNVDRLLTIRPTVSSTAGPSCVITQLLSAHRIPKPDEFTLLAQMSAAISAGRPTHACQILVHLFPTLKFKSPVSSDARHDGPSVVERASRFSAQFWTTAMHAAAKSRSLTLSNRIWRLAVRAERFKHKSAQNTPILDKEAYTTYLHFLHSSLSRLYRKAIAIANKPGESPSKNQFLHSYDTVLKVLCGVVASLRDKAASPISPAVSLDALMIDALMSILECIILIERHFHAPPFPLSGKHNVYSQAGMVDQRTQSQASRILHSIWKILDSYKIKIPKYIDTPGSLRGGSSHANRKSRLRPLPAIPYKLAKSGAVRTRRHELDILDRAPGGNMQQTPASTSNNPPSTGRVGPRREAASIM